MTASTGKPVLLPAFAICVALAASASGGAWAGEDPVVPFPGTSVPGTSVPGTSVPGTSVSGTSVSGTSVSDTDVEGRQESLPEQVPEPSDEAAPEAGAEAAGVAVPAVDAGPSDATVPDGNMAEEKPATPAGGSRLLRALAERPQTLVPETLGSGETARPEAVRVFAAEGCPRALLRRLLAGAAGEADALSALGIEREILTLCRERQEIVAGLFETEKRLSELREAVRTPEPEAPASAASAVPAPRVEAPEANTPVIETAATSPLRAVLGGAAETLVPGKANEADTRAADTRAADTRAGEPQGNTLVRTPRYAWFSIIGTAGALRAGISDGTGVWFVREGDALPGGATIAAIAGRPPGVRVTGAGESGEATLLPFRARPGGGP